MSASLMMMPPPLLARPPRSVFMLNPNPKPLPSLATPRSPLLKKVKPQRKTLVVTSLKEKHEPPKRNFKEIHLTFKDQIPQVYVDNYRKHKMEIEKYECFIIDDLDLSLLEPNGIGQVKQEHNLENIGVAAQFALEGIDLELIRVVRANSQVDQFGLNTWITLEASDYCFYETKVCCELNENDEIVDVEMKFFRPAKFCMGIVDGIGLLQSGPFFGGVRIRDKININSYLKPLSWDYCL